MDTIAPHAATRALTCRPRGAEFCFVTQTRWRRPKRIPIRSWHSSESEKPKSRPYAARGGVEMARAFLARDDSDMPPRPRAATIIAVVTGSRARSGSPTIGRPRPEVQKERRTDCVDWRNRVGAREGGVALACIHLQLPPLMQNTLTGFPTEWQLPWRFPGPGLDTTWLSDDTTQWLVLETTAISRAHARAFFFLHFRSHPRASRPGQSARRCPSTPTNCRRAVCSRVGAAHSPWNMKRTKVGARVRWAQARACSVQANNAVAKRARRREVCGGCGWVGG